MIQPTRNPWMIEKNGVIDMQENNIVKNLGSNSMHWSSSSYSYYRGYSFWSDGAKLYPAIYNDYAFGFSVRKV